MRPRVSLNYRNRNQVFHVDQPTALKANAPIKQEEILSTFLFSFSVSVWLLRLFFETKYIERVITNQRRFSSIHHRVNLFAMKPEILVKLAQLLGLEYELARSV